MGRRRRHALITQSPGRDERGCCRSGMFPNFPRPSCIRMAKRDPPPSVTLFRPCRDSSSLSLVCAATTAEAVVYYLQHEIDKAGIGCVHGHIEQAEPAWMESIPKVIQPKRGIGDRAQNEVHGEFGIYSKVPGPVQKLLIMKRKAVTLRLHEERILLEITDVIKDHRIVCRPDVEQEGESDEPHHDPAMSGRVRCRGRWGKGWTTFFRHGLAEILPK